MKNLLVDALRQASGEVAPPAEEPAADSVAEKADAVPPPDSAGDADLELAESTVLPESVRPTPSANHAFEDSQKTAALAGSDDLPAAPIAEPELTAQSEPAADAEADASADDTIEFTEDDALEDPTMLVPALTAAVASVPSATVTSTAARRLESLLLLGRWSPVLCLLAMSAAAGTLALYQRLSGEHLNVDLATVPGSAARDVDLAGETPGWWQLPDSEALSAVTSPAAGQADSARTPVPAAVAAETAVVSRADTGFVDPAHEFAQAGFEAYDRGDLAAAEAHYRAALDVDPRHRHALIGYAAVLQKTSREDAALAVYETLLTLDPRDTDAIAGLLARSGDAHARESRLKLLLQRHPQVAALHFAMGLTMAELGRWPEAHRAFLEASERAPGNADYSFNVAVSAEHLGQIDVAKTHYENALENVDSGTMIERSAIEAQLDLLAADGGDSS